MSDIQARLVQSLCEQRLPKRKAVAGFTLIELMVVVAVVAILASIALPSYQDSVRKGRRAQAKADLVEYAALAERWRTVNNTYATYTLPEAVSPREGGNARYNLTLVNDASTYTITATPTTGQDADRCGTLTLNQTGRKTNTGTGTLADCW